MAVFSHHVSRVVACGVVACAALIVSGAAAVACGGASQDDLFAGGDGGTGAQTDSGTNQPVDSGATGAGKDSGVLDSGTTKDSGVVPTGATVMCGTNPPCNVPQEVCCRTPNNAGGTTTFVDQCKAPAACTGNTVVPVACDDPTDCTALGQPGGDCCATTQDVDGVNRATSVTCVASGTCTTPTEVVVCAVSGPTSQCPITSTGCAVSKTTLPNYGLCL